MKLSDGFDARRLRTRGPGRWRCRIALAGAAVLACLGILLSMAGIAGLLGHRPTPPLDGSPLALLSVGLLLLWLGILAWRICRARQRRQGSLSIARHLMKIKKPD